MGERESFKQEISELLANYHEKVLEQRYARLILSLAHALDIISVEKEIEPNFSQIEIIKSGNRVSILKDNNFYYLVNNKVKDLKLFCPKRTRSEIEMEFDKMENDQVE